MDPETYDELDDDGDRPPLGIALYLGDAKRVAEHRARMGGTVRLASMFMFKAFTFLSDASIFATLYETLYAALTKKHVTRVDRIMRLQHIAADNKYVLEILRPDLVTYNPEIICFDSYKSCSALSAINDTRFDKGRHITGQAVYWCTCAHNTDHQWALVLHALHTNRDFRNAFCAWINITEYICGMHVSMATPTTIEFNILIQ